MVEEPGFFSKQVRYALQTSRKQMQAAHNIITMHIKMHLRICKDMLYMWFENVPVNFTGISLDEEPPFWIVSPHQTPTSNRPWKTIIVKTQYKDTSQPTAMICAADATFVRRVDELVGSIGTAPHQYVVDLLLQWKKRITVDITMDWSKLIANLSISQLIDKCSDMHLWKRMQFVHTGSQVSILGMTIVASRPPSCRKTWKNKELVFVIWCIWYINH